jgi:hypothetical protein
MMDRNLRVQLSEEGADAERVDVLAGYLRAELLQLDVEDVTSIGAGEAPPGTRGSEVSVVGGLLVTVGQAADSLRSVVLAIREWLRRGTETGRVVRLEIDGDKLELLQASQADQERLTWPTASAAEAGHRAKQGRDHRDHVDAVRSRRRPARRR